MELEKVVQGFGATCAIPEKSINGLRCDGYVSSFQTKALEVRF